jgi:solute carrier family 25 2-oxodicarboxylate transporter 21
MAPSPQLASISPMFASALEGKKRATLSDTENLCVGAFGGVLETVIQSAPRSR